MMVGQLPEIEDVTTISTFVSQLSVALTFGSGPTSATHCTVRSGGTPASVGGIVSTTVIR